MIYYIGDKIQVINSYEAQNYYSGTNGVIKNHNYLIFENPRGNWLLLCKDLYLLDNKVGPSSFI